MAEQLLASGGHLIESNAGQGTLYKEHEARAASNQSKTRGPVEPTKGIPASGTVPDIRNQDLSAPQAVPGSLPPGSAADGRLYVEYSNQELRTSQRASEARTIRLE